MTAGAPVARAASRRKAHRRWSLSTQWTTALGSPGELDGDDQPGKAGAGAHVEPARRALGQRQKLGAVGDVTRPDGREGRFGDEIGRPAPAGEQIDEDREAVLCFT